VREVWILYQRELRSAFRERAIVVNSILIPIFLYPIMLWVMFSGMTLVEGLGEGFTSRVLVLGTPDEHRQLVDSLKAAERVEVTEEPGLSQQEALARLQARDADAVLEFLPPDAGGSLLPGNARLRVRYDGAIERSTRAEARVEEVVSRYRTSWLEGQAERVGLSREDLAGFRVDPHSVASGRDMGALILSEMIPLFLIIMVVLGCFHPAIDATAGERERSTWETLMSVSASRLSIVTAKYLYVATLGTVAGILNVVAMTLSVGGILKPFIASRNPDAAVQFAFPISAVPLMLVSAVILGLLFAAMMMILAAFARTFKEGQGMITPLTWLIFFPLLAGGSQDRTLTPLTALIPVLNVVQMIKDAIRGVYLWPLIGETLLAESLLVVGCLFVARSVLSVEDVVMGSHGGSFWSFLRSRMGRASPGAAR
jgi:sodium transport system permease protein